MADRRQVALVTKPWLGTVEPADAAFGREMLDKFFHALESAERKPTTICFYTEGVKCLAAGSPFLLSLRMLQEMGVDLLLCGSCVEHYELSDVIAFGEIGTMKEIVDLLTPPPPPEEEGAGGPSS